MQQRRKPPGCLSPFTRTAHISLLLAAFLLAEDQVTSFKHRRLPRVDKQIKFVSLLIHLHLALHVPYTKHHPSLLHKALYQKGQSLQGSLCSSHRIHTLPATLGWFSNPTKGIKDLILTAPSASTQSSKLSKQIFLSPLLRHRKAPVADRRCLGLALHTQLRPVAEHPAWYTEKVWFILLL